MRSLNTLSNNEVVLSVIIADTNLCKPSAFQLLWTGQMGLKTRIVWNESFPCDVRRSGRAISCKLTRSLASAANAMIDVHNFRFQSSDGGVSTSTTGSRSSAPSCPRPMTREYEFLFFRFFFSYSYFSTPYPTLLALFSLFPPLGLLPVAPFALRLARRVSLFS